MAGKIAEGAKAVAGAAGRGAAAVGKGAINIMMSPYKESIGQRFAEKIPKFALGGAVFVVAMVILFNIAGGGMNTIILSIFIGAAIGAALGLVDVYFPKIWGGLFVTLLIVIVIFFFASFTGLVAEEVPQTIFGNAWGDIKYPADVAWDKIKCPFQKDRSIQECFGVSGWESESEPEIIALNVEFKTGELFYDGRDQEIIAEIQVTNSKDKGVKFFLEPKCFIDDKEVNTEIYGPKESGKLVFLAKDSQQGASVVCKVPSEMLIEKNSVKATIEMERPVIQTVRWPVYTIKREYLETRENLPSEIYEGKGKTSTYFGVPYEFGIGVYGSVPLTEGEQRLNIQLKKEVSPAEITGLKQINYIRVGGGGETAKIDYCEEFKTEGDVFVLKDINQERIKEQGLDNGFSYPCELDITPITASQTETAQQKVTFEGEINYVVGFKKEQSILIFKAGAMA